MDLRRRLGEILDAASAGETILIERDRKPLAFLVSYEVGGDLVTRDDEKVARQLQALDELVEMGRAWRREHPPEPGDPTAAEWIRWDRDHRDEEKDARSFGKAEREDRATSRGPKAG
jgi:antitoxin (DNA-binding transcriptional repressor) of toxin-antitoxin stability system